MPEIKGDIPQQTGEMPTIAVVVGASGGIGNAVVAQLVAGGLFRHVIGLGRGTTPPLDLTSEVTIAAAAHDVAALGGDVRLVVVATGVLQAGGISPEKSLRQLDPAQLAYLFAVNAIGPALLMKHFLPLLPRDGKSVFATLSAKVGSIGDNQLGGWYSYRASKAALNQLVHTAAVELKRRAPEAICVALHPGTVATGLSSPFAKSGLDVQTPEVAAERLLRVIDNLTPADTGGFFDYRGQRLPW